MGSRYSPSVKEGAMRLWLSGRTDEDIARTLGIRRADTIRDWRRTGNWEHFREIIRNGVDEQIAAMRTEKVRALNERHDQLGAAIEQQAVKQLQALSSSGDLTPADLRAISGSLLNSQKLRRTALDADDQPPPKDAHPGPPIIVYQLAKAPRRPRPAQTEQRCASEPGAA
jgi:hypothetical protein